MYDEKELRLAHRTGLMVGGFFGFGFAVILCLMVGLFVT